jgi:hypothetical protein
MRSYFVSFLLLAIVFSTIKSFTPLTLWHKVFFVSVIYIAVYDIIDLYVSISSLLLQGIWIVSIFIAVFCTIVVLFKK